jgi:alpha-tubulin suppressor-like RCC1 family protein
MMFVQCTSKHLMGRTLYRLHQDNNIASHWMIQGTQSSYLSLYSSTGASTSSVVYVWGYNGYCRLGLGNQVDVLKPKPVPQVMLSYFLFCLYHTEIQCSQFSGQSESALATTVSAGPTNSVVVDKQGLYHMAGKVFHDSLHFP